VKFARKETILQDDLFPREKSRHALKSQTLKIDPQGETGEKKSAYPSLSMRFFLTIKPLYG
jgi:hypothetical protein